VLGDAFVNPEERAGFVDVRIVVFSETRVAVVEHRGPPEREYETSRRLIEWRIAHRLSPAKHQTYGVHYTDPATIPPADHRVDFCVTYDQPIEPNPQGVVGKIIPANRCAVARHLGSRSHNAAAIFLYREWLPISGESPGDFPVFFHYVNVGPDVQDHEMITDVYLPLKRNG
jgi:AraC family transcriptional regulator